MFSYLSVRDAVDFVTSSHLFVTSSHLLVVRDRRKFNEIDFLTTFDKRRFKLSSKATVNERRNETSQGCVVVDNDVSPGDAFLLLLLLLLLCFQMSWWNFGVSRDDLNVDLDGGFLFSARSVLLVGVASDSRKKKYEVQCDQIRSVL
jgi:hypothetical protein